MNGYLAVDELEVTVRAGRGVAVLLEGESAEEDPWFYGQWFGDRARQVTFFPQDGWSRVIEAVAELRWRCPDVPVYGIIDRDFAEDEALEADFANHGILRTPRYALENYLLDAECWAAVFGLIFRRKGGAPQGWDQPEAVQGQIEAAYRACLDLAAHNFVVKYGWVNYPELARQTPEQDRSYRDHPAAFRVVSPSDRLASWGLQMGCPEDLGARFRAQRATLETAGLGDWQKAVSGKYVLHVLQGRFPLLPGAGRFGLSHYLNLYVDRCPRPPPDLVRILDRIISAAGGAGRDVEETMLGDLDSHEIRENQVPIVQFSLPYGVGWTCEYALRGSRDWIFTVVVKSLSGQRTQDNLVRVRDLARETTNSRRREGRFVVGGYYCYRWEPEGPNAMPLTLVDCDDISPGILRSP
jgi:hypothetical protein